MNSTEDYKKMASVREKEPFSGINGSNRWACKGGKLSWDQTKMSLMHQKIRSCKKAGSFCLVVRSCQFIRYLSGAIRRYRDNILHCIAIKLALDFFKKCLSRFLGEVSEPFYERLAVICVQTKQWKKVNHQGRSCVYPQIPWQLAVMERRNRHTVWGSSQCFSTLSCACPFLWYFGSSWLLLLYASVTNAEI